MKPSSHQTMRINKSTACGRLCAMKMKSAKVDLRLSTAVSPPHRVQCGGTLLHLQVSLADSASNGNGQPHLFGWCVVQSTGASLRLARTLGCDRFLGLSVGSLADFRSRPQPLATGAGADRWGHFNTRVVQRRSTTADEQPTAHLPRDRHPVRSARRVVFRRRSPGGGCSWWRYLHPRCTPPEVVATLRHVRSERRPDSPILWLFIIADACFFALYLFEVLSTLFPPNSLAYT